MSGQVYATVGCYIWYSEEGPGRAALIATLKPQSNGPSYSNTGIGTLAVDGWAVTFGTARRGLGTGRSRSPWGPLLAVPNVTAHHQRPVYQLLVLFDVAL